MADVYAMDGRNVYKLGRGGRMAERDSVVECRAYHGYYCRIGKEGEGVDEDYDDTVDCTLLAAGHQPSDSLGGQFLVGVSDTYHGCAGSDAARRHLGRGATC